MIRNETVLMRGAFIFHHSNPYAHPTPTHVFHLNCHILHGAIGTIPIELPAIILYYK